MTWQDFSPFSRETRMQPEQAVRLGLGMGMGAAAAPLWAAFYAAAGAGVAYWWMTGWTRRTAAAEAKSFAPAEPLALVAPKAETAAETLAEPMVETAIEAPVEAAAQIVPKMVDQIVPEVAAPALEAVEAVAEASVEAPAEALDAAAAELVEIAVERPTEVAETVAELAPAAIAAKPAARRKTTPKLDA